MRTGVCRAIANGLCGALRRLLPGGVRQWADAIRGEIDRMPDDGEALRFALGACAALIPHALLARLRAALAGLSGGASSSGERTVMRSGFDLVSQPRLAGAIASIAAVGLGVAYMAAAGAPPTYLALNLGALGLGLAALAVTAHLPLDGGRWAGLEIFAMASALLATALFGLSVEGAARWVALGPVLVQASLILVPVMVVGFARRPNGLGAAGLCVGALALALQPDRAMAGVLLAGLAALALWRLDRFIGTALAGAASAFIVTLMRPDTLPAVPYVDHILFSAFDVHPLAGIGVWAGAALLLAPAIAGWRAEPGVRAPIFAFGAVWGAVILAAALGNYPTPLVGYGGSAIIGYLLCLAALPKSVALRPREGSEGAAARDRDQSTWSVRAQAAALAGLLIFGLAGSSAQASSNECARTEVGKVEQPDTVWHPGPDGEQVPLWPDSAALELPDYGGNAEMIGSGSPLVAGRIWNWATFVSQPTMTIYRPGAMNTGAAVLVLPGGGYTAVAMDLEGTEICAWITREGVTCIVLKYRTPQPWPRGQQPAVLFALHDAQRAMGVLRQNASDYRIKPDRIGVIGFSAGAHLAAAVSNADARAYAAVDAADSLSARPDFAVLLYTGRLWDRTAPRASLTLAPWVRISRAAPPTLLIHAMNDPVDDVRHPMAYALALHDAGVPVDMRVFAGGCHAFGLRPTEDPVTRRWPGMVLQWLQDIRML
jgi:acetyl esterase/lipase